MNWSEISGEKGLTEEFMREHAHQLIWELLSKSQTFREEFIEEMQEHVVWTYLVMDQQLSEEFLHKHYENIKDYFSWIWRKQNVSVSFIETYKERVDWLQLSYNEILSKEVIETYQDKLDWTALTSSYPLTEEFIRMFRLNIRWNHIPHHFLKTASFSFCNTYKEKLDSRLRSLQQENPLQFTKEEWEELIDEETFSLEDIEYLMKHFE